MLRHRHNFWNERTLYSFQDPTPHLQVPAFDDQYFDFLKLNAPWMPAVKVFLSEWFNGLFRIWTFTQIVNHHRSYIFFSAITSAWAWAVEQTHYEYLTQNLFVMQAILGDDCKLVIIGCMLAIHDSDMQVCPVIYYKIENPSILTFIFCTDHFNVF